MYLARSAARAALVALIISLLCGASICNKIIMAIAVADGVPYARIVANTMPKYNHYISLTKQWR